MYVKRKTIVNVVEELVSRFEPYSERICVIKIKDQRGFFVIELEEKRKIKPTSFKIRFRLSTYKGRTQRGAGGSCPLILFCIQFVGGSKKSRLTNWEQKLVAPASVWGSYTLEERGYAPRYIVQVLYTAYTSTRASTSGLVACSSRRTTSTTLLVSKVRTFIVASVRETNPTTGYNEIQKMIRKEFMDFVELKAQYIVLSIVYAHDLIIVGSGSLESSSQRVIDLLIQWTKKHKPIVLWSQTFKMVLLKGILRNQKRHSPDWWPPSAVDQLCHVFKV